MVTVRILHEDELADALVFEEQFVGTETTLEAFRERYERTPGLFVGAFDGGELVGEASGRRSERHDNVELTAIGTRNGREHEGIGSAVLSTFEKHAASYADRITVASAGNVEGFYRANGYEPRTVLVQVPETDLPQDYADRVDLVDERSPEQGWRFCYVEFETYSERIRDSIADRLHAASVNTIFAKQCE